MDHLTETQLETLRQRLAREHDTLCGRASQLMADETSADPDTGDRQDAAASEAARALDHRLARHELERVREIEAALERMADGTYGICEETGEEISYARLRHRPTARYTVEAQELLEREEAARVRVHGKVDEDPY